MVQIVLILICGAGFWFTDSQIREKKFEENANYKKIERNLAINGFIWGFLFLFLIYATSL